jgi:hypothetical protein
MADADRLPRTGNIGRAAGLDPRPSLSKPTTAVFRVYLAHFLGTDLVRTVGTRLVVGGITATAPDSAPLRGVVHWAGMTGGPPIPVCRGVTALRHAAVLGGTRRKPGREVPCGARLRVSRQ